MIVAPQPQGIMGINAKLVWLIENVMLWNVKKEKKRSIPLPTDLFNSNNDDKQYKNVYLYYEYKWNNINNNKNILLLMLN